MASLGLKNSINFFLEVFNPLFGSHLVLVILYSLRVEEKEATPVLDSGTLVIGYSFYFLDRSNYKIISDPTNKSYNCP